MKNEISFIDFAHASSLLEVTTVIASKSVAQQKKLSKLVKSSEVIFNFTKYELSDREKRKVFCERFKLPKYLFRLR